jgi:hypothetical protein
VFFTDQPRQLPDFQNPFFFQGNSSHNHIRTVQRLLQRMRPAIRVFLIRFLNSKADDSISIFLKKRYHKSRTSVSSDNRNIVFRHSCPPDCRCHKSTYCLIKLYAAYPLLCLSGKRIWKTPRNRICCSTAENACKKGTIPSNAFLLYFHFI